MASLNRRQHTIDFQDQAGEGSAHLGHHLGVVGRGNMIGLDEDLS